MVRLRLLGAVSWDGVAIRGGRLGGLLALLAEELRVGCGAGRLVESLWAEELPEHPAKALQTLVSRVRAVVGSEVVVSTASGYRLALDEEQVDVAAVLVRVAESRRFAGAGEHAAALASAEAGLALFEGAEAGGDGPLGELRAARCDTRGELERAKGLALSRLGLAGEALGALTELAKERTRDEELLVELLRCEAAVVGNSAALERYEEYRRSLRDELGSDPGAALQQVQRELLAADAPVLRSGVRHEPNSLLGRAGDIAAVLGLLREARVTSVVGAGGLGKTRLAHAVAREAPQRVVHFVELAGVATDDDVLGEVASAVGVGDAPSPVDGIVTALGAGLLVLDNCEHVLSGAADLVRELVFRTPEMRILITSRAPLGLSSEAVYPLPHLDLTTMVALFSQRARAARPAAGLPPTEVRELCASLDGLPLAAELAAARVRVMSVDEINKRLDDRFALLRGGGRDAPERHRTLHAVIDWSWHLLEPGAQSAMRTLSVFSGGFTADAAAFVTGDDGIVERLVDQSLLQVVEGEAGTRLRMLETVREFGVARREEAGETERVVDRFLEWVRDCAMRQPDSGLDTEIVRAVDAIRAEQDNLLQALRYAFDRDDNATIAAAASLLGTLWVTDSNLSRLAGLAADVPPALSRLRPAPDLIEATRAAAVWCAMSAFLIRGPRPLRALVTLRRLPPPDPDTMVGAAQIALCAPNLAALRELCDSERPLVAGAANFAHSYLAESANDLDSALESARRMLDRTGDAGPWMRALAHSRIGELCLQVDPGREAYLHLNAALSLMEELGAWPSAARARWAIVLANLQRGAFEEAEQGLDHLGDADLLEESGRRMFDACARAEILLSRGDIDGGLELWREAVDQLRDTHDRWALEVSAVAVVAHARHGRLDLVADVAGALPGMLSAMLPSASAADFPGCGTLALAIAVSTEDAGAKAHLIALAERFGVRQDFQPTMSLAWARSVAMEADPAAYASAVSAYAGLGLDDLRHRLGSRLNSARAHT
ncbi:ATP-binding protein [Paractinoplanes globisporus]|uniref:ATP-binding protein n=1 Tax=Paractinoplanes globisporus TaxID=113565 RepID=UPI0003767107|nr:BTAD domain-containing putative transcriptional regulator [Actinoplanes globisporus]